jgi:hypothetical protein
MQMYTLVGMCPPKNRQGKVIVGDLLARDLPNKIACSICLRYHHIEHAENYMPSSYPKRVWNVLNIPCVRDCFEGDDASCSLIGEDFSAVLFKMAMKRYRQKHDYTEILELMSPKGYISCLAGYPRLSETKCITVEGSLMQRLQNVLVSPDPSKWCNSGINDPQLKICPHLKAKQSRIGLRIVELNPADPQTHHNRLMSWRFIKSFVLSSANCGVQSCRFCKTDYRIDFKDYPRGGQAVFFTWWKDLGAWSDGENYLRHIKGDGSFPARSSPRSGEVATKFEGDAEYAFDSLMTAENEKELCNAQKKRRENERKSASWEKNYRFD